MAPRTPPLTNFSQQRYQNPQIKNSYIKNSPPMKFLKTNLILIGLLGYGLSDEYGSQPNPILLDSLIAQNPVNEQSRVFSTGFGEGADGRGVEGNGGAGQVDRNIRVNSGTFFYTNIPAVQTTSAWLPSTPFGSQDDVSGLNDGSVSPIYKVIGNDPLGAIWPNLDSASYIPQPQPPTPIPSPTPPAPTNQQTNQLYPQFIHYPQVQYPDPETYPSRTPVPLPSSLDNGRIPVNYYAGIVYPPGYVPAEPTGNEPIRYPGKYEDSYGKSQNKQGDNTFSHIVTTPTLNIRVQQQKRP